jgi:hypothetical protein
LTYGATADVVLNISAKSKPAVISLKKLKRFGDSGMSGEGCIMT